jgi:uncharacterized protein
MMNKRLQNYHELVRRVDELCSNAEKLLSGHLRCAEGCSSCCKSITLFHVEAEAVLDGVNSLPQAEADLIRSLAEKNAAGDTCPLLLNDRCLIYPFRPIICRTHGLPIIFSENGKRRVDYCPENLQGCKSVPGAAVIDLDRLNALLVAVNSLFVSQEASGKEASERVEIGRAVMEKV